MYLEDLERVRISEEISPALNGGNFVATANSADANDPFFNVADALSLSSIRFPGGDLTERYLTPSGELWDSWVNSQEPTISLPDGRQIATLHSFLNHASQERLQISFVIPTEGLLIRLPDGSLAIDQSALDNVIELVDGMISGEYGALDIRQFEIGNEYYLDGRLTAEEYGFVTNEVVNALSSTFDAYGEGPNGQFFDEPDIVVQAAPPWQTGDNQIIIDSLDADTRGAIDGVIIHWYPRNLDQIGNLDRSFSSINEWEQAQGFSNLDLHVTEWNVFVGPQADTGAYQASTLLEGYEHLAAFDVDSADIWGVEFRRLMTGLARPNQSDDAEEESQNFNLTPAGEIIRSLYHTTPGLHSLDLDPDDVLDNASEFGAENADYTLTSFGDEDRAVVYLGSRADHTVSVDFDQGDYFLGAHHVVVQTFSTYDDPTTTAVDESVPETAPYVQVQTATYTHEQFANLSVDLDPGEIVRIEYVLGDVGVSIEGQVGAPVPGMSYDDRFSGTGHDDTLSGNQGKDSIEGNRGQDLLYGGTGDDTLRGDHQSDLIEGGEGDDRLFGGANADVLIGGEGDDTVIGGNQADLLFGGEGTNELLGGDGNDTLVSTGTDDTLAGGEGADLYSISTSENAFIEGWSADQGDLISFQGQYTDPDDLRDRMVEVTYNDGRPGDLIIEHDGGTRTTIIGAAGQQESVIASLFDNQPLGANTLLQADFLSSLTPNQVGALTGALNTEEYATYRQTIDPTLLAQNLDGERLAHFLNGLGQSDAYNFINDIPEGPRHDLLEDMQGTELNGFLSELDYESMVALLRSVDSATFRGLSPSFDDATRAHVEGMLGRFATDYEEHHAHPDDSALSDISSLFLPPDEDGERPPHHPPEENPDDQDNHHEAPSVGAGCFIATAVYADPDHPDVWLLRWFRDEVLRKSLLGRAFIVAYWHLGPRIAEAVSRDQILVRIFYTLIRLCVCLICIWFRRETGRQPDHRDHPSSRLIRIGRAARMFRNQREATR